MRKTTWISIVPISSEVLRVLLGVFLPLRRTCYPPRTADSPSRSLYGGVPHVSSSQGHPFSCKYLRAGSVPFRLRKGTCPSSKGTRSRASTETAVPIRLRSTDESKGTRSRASTGERASVHYGLRKGTCPSSKGTRSRASTGERASAHYGLRKSTCTSPKGTRSRASTGERASVHYRLRRARVCTPITVVLSRPLQQSYTPPRSSVVAYVFRSFTKKSNDSLVG